MAAVVDCDACTGQGVRNTIADLVDTNKLVVIQELSSVVDIYCTLELHVYFLEHFIDRIAEILVVLELVVNFPDRLVTTVADKSDIHLHLFGQYEIACCHCIEDRKVDRAECTGSRATTCTLEGDEFNTEFLHCLDRGGFDTGVRFGAMHPR